MNAGWLRAQPDLSNDFGHGVVIGRVDGHPEWFPTRREEYTLMRDLFENWERGRVLDMGAGFNPDVHLAPEILANLGYEVIAVDAHPDSVTKMSPHKNILRVCTNMLTLELARPNDYAVCISTLEHLAPEHQLLAAQVVYKYLKDGGKFLVTADEFPPDALNALLASAGFATGVVVPHDDPLTSPRVGWALVQKLGG